MENIAAILCNRLIRFFMFVLDFNNVNENDRSSEKLKSI